MSRTIIAILALSLAIPAVAHEKEYTMADLTALAESEEWDELLLHVKDVTPKDRKGPWKALVEQAGIGVLMKAKTKNDNEAFGAAYNLVDQYPTLKKAPKFMKLRGEVGINAIGSCFKQRYGVSQCMEILNSFLSADKTNAEAHFKAGKVVRLQTTPHAGASPYFVTAFKNTKDKGKTAEMCKDEDVKLAAMSAVVNPPSYDSVKAGMKLIFTHCYKELGDGAFEEFLSGNSYAANNTCAMWKKKKRKLSTFQKAHCKDAKAK